MHYIVYVPCHTIKKRKKKKKMENGELKINTGLEYTTLCPRDDRNGEFVGFSRHKYNRKFV